MPERAMPTLRAARAACSEANDFAEDGGYPATRVPRALRAWVLAA